MLLRSDKIEDKLLQQEKDNKGTNDGKTSVQSMRRYVDDVALDSPPKNEKATWDELPFEKDEIQHLHPTKSCRHLGVEIYEKQLTDTLYLIIYSQCKYVEKIVNDFF